MPAVDENSGGLIELVPGETTLLSFQLIKIADLEKTDRQWLRLINGSETYLIETTAPIRYIDIQGNDGLIRMRDDQGTLWKFLLNFENCPEQHNPNFIDEISITGPPEAGVPVSMCKN